MWPHENITYSIYGISDNVSSGSPAISGSIAPALGIIAMTATDHARLN